MKLVYNEKRALLEQGCHLNAYNSKSNHFVRFPKVQIHEEYM